ncbi:MAG: hypothetical protein DMD38_02440 [Gemmatimonadetes bacterium]|nr:MAG: hypothetical protein AUI86_05975 [Gemmatimonadetes bacterium 13_1_40CM_3_66_12]OLD85563.1 MAG: hypothetical protein AUG85_13315 [Gemmatimonadetes bacterium 13_1_20CM_4_66_11]PYP98265.1 MAG: hypothetical protein DMD38_02440 [Gemmatimonadota bacterium]
MFEQEDDIVERMIQQLRRPVAVDPALDARVLQAITAPRPSQRRVWPWLAAAAMLGAVMIWRPWSRGSGADRPDTLQFVLVAPQANSVSLVGDFNDWDPKRSPMRTANGIWAAVVQLAPGRYRYAFLVNGVEWRADPGAPAARDDEFGTPSSVVTVGGRGS